METLIDIAQGVLAFALLIVITVGWHEFGHFIVAKKCGVKVLEFAIGMGKTVFEKKGKDGVIYKFCALPIGGYVRMLNDADYEGEDKEKFLEEDKEKTFEAASLWKRSLIVAAGPFFNLIMAVGLFSYLGYNYTYTVKPVVGYVSEQISTVEGSDSLNVGDIILKANGKEIKSTTDFHINTLTTVGDELELETTTGKKVIIDLKSETLSNKNSDHQLFMGFTFITSTTTNEISKVFPDSPAEAFGLKEGDIVKYINGNKTPNFYEIQRAILKLNEGDKAVFDVLRNGESVTLTIEPKYKGNDLDDKKATFGFSPVSTPLDMAFVESEDKTIVQAFFEGVNKSYTFAEMTLSSLYKIIVGDISPKMLGGAVTIGHSAKVSIENGLVSFLTFLGLFNINLMVMNLLPIPPLDGGHLAKFGVESVIRREINEKYINFIQRVGIAGICMLMAWGFFADYLRFIN